MTRRAKNLGWVLLVMVLVPVAAVGVFLLTFDPNAYAPDLITSIEAATGRSVTIGSKLTIGLSFTPEIEADNVSLANPAGFRDANFLTLQKVEATASRPACAGISTPPAASALQCHARRG
jgi:uncharacterized protein involved in outer membrane biogenesis